MEYLGSIENINVFSRNKEKTISLYFIKEISLFFEYIAYEGAVYIYYLKEIVFIIIILYL